MRGTGEFRKLLKVVSERAVIPGPAEMTSDVQLRSTTIQTRMVLD